MKIIRYQNTPLYTPSLNYPGLRSEMDRLFEAAFPALTTLQPNGFFVGSEGQFPVDLYQDKDAFTVRAELPGFRKEDIGVEVEDGVLTVTGQQKTETKTEAATEQKDQPAAATQERRVSRAVTLPENVDVEKIGATYENGVLTVTLPKRAEVKPKQIAIEVK